MIEEYTPHPPTADYWHLVRDFVVACVGRRAPDSIRTVRAHLTQLADYAVWLWQDGTPLEPVSAFDADIIDMYVRHTLRNKGKDKYYRYRVELCLTSYAELLTGVKIQRKLGTTPTVPAPYRPAELRAFLNVAHSQPTPSARRDLAAALALGAGAGLMTHEMLHLKVGDVEPTDFGHLIHVKGRKARSIPLRHDWISTLDPLVLDRGPDDYVAWTLRTRSDQTTLSRGLLKRVSGKAPDLGRLRTTWIVQLLTLGLPIDRCLELARIRTLQGLKPYYDMVPERETRIDDLLIIAGLEDPR
ncbi:hypothetical protein DCE93_01220 [Agromyces badenianii]|uniref:Tyr recombinase domain-containing protein n=1 Tax=Agromyces badenianii TaxID=2080742 RepID=A0A2S0WT37_9MICO|nr:hypothetical protein [Agromyces badenianii]AWB94458.1 hypothetical protein DCE93_01220 [Agromyces badenianii]